MYRNINFIVYEGMRLKYNLSVIQVVKEDAEDKKEGDAALNELFQKIYADGSEETKRAMVKSFQVSRYLYSILEHSSFY